MEKVIALEWKKRYELGHFDIDAEHRIFHHIIQKIQAAYLRRVPINYLESLVDELIKYAEFHFCSEENLMVAVHYPELERHKEIHRNLLLQLKEEVNTIVFKYINFSSLITFLYEWFVQHTITEDKKLATYISNLKNGSDS